MQNIAIILAGGTGSRFSHIKPKQFFSIKNKEIIQYTTEAFLSCNINHIIIVCHQDFYNHTKELFHNIKNVTVILGGATRFRSSLNALEYINETQYNNVHNINVLIHDAARPLISTEIIHNCILELEKNKAVVVAIPVYETIVRVKDGIMQESLNREEIFINQTPQCFNFNLIYNAYKKTTHHNFTDDASVLQNLYNIKIIHGSKKNIKITNQEDLSLAEFYLNLK